VAEKTGNGGLGTWTRTQRWGHLDEGSAAGRRCAWMGWTDDGGARRLEGEE
jgi:hypothetical protein